MSDERLEQWIRIERSGLFWRGECLKCPKTVSSPNFLAAVSMGVCHCYEAHGGMPTLCELYGPKAEEGENKNEEVLHAL